MKCGEGRWGYEQREQRANSAWAKRRVTDEQQEQLWQVTRNGEIVGRTPNPVEMLAKIAELTGTVEDLERDMRRARHRERLLLSRLEEDRADYPRFDEVFTIFDEWRAVCSHGRARLTDDRFDAVRRMLEVTKPEPYPREAFTRAFEGAAFDPYRRQRKNGTWQRFDDIALICRSGQHMEEFIRRAPRKEG